MPLYITVIHDDSAWAPYTDTAAGVADFLRTQLPEELNDAEDGDDLPVTLRAVRMSKEDFAALPEWEP